jgi:hypothetical protein
MEVSVEDHGCNFPEKSVWWYFNVGFMRVVPSEMTIEICKRWLINSVNNKGPIDQWAICYLVRRFQLVERDGPTMLINTSRILGQKGGDRHLVLYFYHPLDSQNGNMLLGRRKYFSVMAYRKKISEPYVTHLAAIEPWRKIPWFKSNGLWFLRSDGFTCNMPKKLFYYNWRNGNYSDTEKQVCQVG